MNRRKIAVIFCIICMFTAGCGAKTEQTEMQNAHIPRVKHINLPRRILILVDKSRNDKRGNKAHRHRYNLCRKRNYYVARKFFSCYFLSH